MSAKIINLSDFAYKRIWLDCKRDVDAMTKEYKYALAHGVCDYCGASSSDVAESGASSTNVENFRPMYLCGVCREEE